MVFEEFPGHLPGQLSSDMMDKMFDLPDAKYSMEPGTSVRTDLSPQDSSSIGGARSGSMVSPGGQHQNDSGQLGSRRQSPAPGMSTSSLEVRRVHSASISSNASQRSGSISSTYGQHAGLYADNDDGSGVDPNLFYSPAMGPHNLDGTPLMSPHQVPFAVETFGDFAIPPAYVESPAASPSLNPQKRKVKVAGRVVKNSPQLRAKLRRSSLTSLSSLPGPGRSAHTSPDKPDDDITELIMPPGADVEHSQSLASGQAVTPATLMGLQFDHDQRRSSYEAPRQETPHTQLGPVDHRSVHSSRSSSVQPSPATTPVLAPAIQQRQASMRASNSANRPQHNRLRSVPVSAPISPAMNANNNQSEQDFASLLASKSNIQGIMEGVHHQMGLQYSEKMTTELSSKKTTHKMAEQERRNRMNSALVELGRLVAPTESQLSKAATVEAAIEYIRHSNERVMMLEKKLAEYEIPP